MMFKNCQLSFVNTRFNVRFFFVIPFLLLLLAGLVVPSDGNHGLFTIKSLAFLGSVVSIGSYFLLSRKVSVKQGKIFLFFSVTFAGLLIWVFVGILEGETPLESTFDQFKIFLITIFVFSLSSYIIQEGLLTFQAFIKAIIYFNFLYSFAKVMTILLFLMGLINFEAFLKITGIDYMTMAIYGDISRFQTSVDITTPFILLFVLQSKRLGINFDKKFVVFFIIVSLFSIFLSFSRYLFFIAGCSFLLYWATLPFKKALKWVIFGLLSAIALVFWIGPDKVYFIIEMRFFSSNVDMSDSVRTEQVQAMMNEFYNYPFFGKGMGSYASEYIRRGHSYEVQWVAFLMQFGIVGIALLLFMSGMIGIKFLTSPLSRVKCSFLLLFTLWILSGFTNPFLISLTSGIMYSIFAHTGDFLNKPQEFPKVKNSLF